MKTLLLAIALALSLSAHAQDKGVAPSDDVAPPPRQSAAKILPAPPGKEWDYWYTVTVNGKIPYEYYHETIEAKEGRLVYKLHAWKKEDDFINEEQLGAFARAEDLAPLFFNFHATYRGTEKTIDGTVQPDGKLLVIRIAEGSAGDLKPKPEIRRTVPKGAFLSSFFPQWLSRQGAKLKPGRVLPFTSILEDGGDGANPFANAAGTVKPVPGAEPAFEVGFRGQKSKWIFDAAGAPTRIDMPQSRAVVQRVTEAAAKKFLGP
jgi:hypothetical protein